MISTPDSSPTATDPNERDPLSQHQIGFVRTRVGGGAEETATSLALLRSVATGESLETIRVHESNRVVAFGRQDVVANGYDGAVRATLDAGFEPVERLAGGRAAVFHESTIAFAWASPTPDPKVGVTERFVWLADVIRSALRRLGAPVNVGEIPGEYCPGRYSLNLWGSRKVMGVGQRLIRGGAHVGGVIVVSDPERIRAVLAPVYAHLGIDWDPTTVGSLDEAVPGVQNEDVVVALRSELSARRPTVDIELDTSVIAAGRAGAEHHRSVGAR